jgi:hypothetical protein
MDLTLERSVEAIDRATRGPHSRTGGGISRPPGSRSGPGRKDCQARSARIASRGSWVRVPSLRNESGPVPGGRRDASAPPPPAVNGCSHDRSHRRRRPGRIPNPITSTLAEPAGSPMGQCSPSCARVHVRRIDGTADRRFSWPAGRRSSPVERPPLRSRDTGAQRARPSLRNGQPEPRPHPSAPEDVPNRAALAAIEPSAR